MKKLILAFTAILVIGSSFVYAKPVNTMVIQSKSMSTNKNAMLSDIDRNLIFNDGANAVLLDNNEMMATQGQSWFSNWILPVLTVGGVLTCAAFAPPCALAFAF